MPPAAWRALHLPLRAPARAQVRESINALAETWTREQKDHCLQETEASFKYSGVLLRCITESQ
jgi:hypothetical protein